MIEFVGTFLILVAILTFTIPLIMGMAVYMVVFNWHRATVDASKMYRDFTLPKGARTDGTGEA